MNKIEIPRDQWSSFFNDFNKQNADKIVKVEVTDNEDYRIDYAESLPFKEVRITSQNNDGTTVSISAGASNSFSYSIDKAAMVIMEERKESVKLLQVKSALGKTAVVRFHPLDENDDLM